MIIWKGKGIAVFLSFLAGMIILALFKLEFEICAVAGFFTSAITSLYFGKKWNTAEAREFIDKKTGRHFIMRPDHSFFFIKVEYWFFISSILGIITLFTVSKIAGVIAVGLFIITLIIIFSKKKESEPLSNNKRAREQRFEKMSNADKTIADIVPEQKESYEERERRRLEKEDASRFMPR
jgi:uncharacterized membrane protein YjjP (DUF1212 family)